MRMLVLLAVLAGCAQQQSQTSQEAEDMAHCGDLGLSYGTGDYAQCVEGREQMRAAAAASARSDALKYLANAPKPYITPLPPLQPAPVNQMPLRQTTICHWQGAYMYCQ